VTRLTIAFLVTLALVGCAWIAKCEEHTNAHFTLRLASPTSLAAVYSSRAPAETRMGSGTLPDRRLVQALSARPPAGELLPLSDPWPAAQIPTRDCIIGRESHYDTWAVGAAGERGLMQIHPVHAWRFEPYGGFDAAFTPEVNLLVGYELYRDQGWWPWVAQKGVCW